MNCGKVRYSTLDEAKLALLNCRLHRMFRNKNQRREGDIYYCRDCGGFHLTSKSARRIP